ncbi:hypothetical protein B0H17DRAFT_1127120 [Mycena rosella]|uniref:Uncharacterized protein n=1 Tax=Mycena rosella TaxID=1033263 RepID=A0AAD7GSA5_MYCRO|nr:hypothetical protein B0H17DRAFT_1127120 [Mycena rosella]
MSLPAPSSLFFPPFLLFLISYWPSTHSTDIAPGRAQYLPLGVALTLASAVARAVRPDARPDLPRTVSFMPFRLLHPSFSSTSLLTIRPTSPAPSRPQQAHVRYSGIEGAYADLGLQLPDNLPRATDTRVQVPSATRSQSPRGPQNDLREQRDRREWHGLVQIRS